MTEQVRLSESPSRKIPEGGMILTVGATVENWRKENEKVHEYDEHNRNTNGSK